MEQGNELKLTFIETLFPLIQSFIPLNKINPLCQKNSSKIVSPLNIWIFFFFTSHRLCPILLGPQRKQFIKYFFGKPRKEFTVGLMWTVKTEVKIFPCI